MSITPQNLPTRTRVLAKDLLFKEKHELSDTQVDIMSYIFNAFTWTMKIRGYMVLTTKKFANDLPHIGKKTLESSLKELEIKGLIKRTLVNVPSWNNARVRGIKITLAGMEYNSSFYAPTHQAIVHAFQERIDELEQKETKEENEPREDDPTTDTKIRESCDETQQESGEDTEVDEASQRTGDGQERQREEKVTVATVEAFVHNIRKQFLLSSQPICNMVEGWQKETTFYLNSYGKLSLITQNMDYKQLKNPLEINKFWQWLFKNQHRVGKIIDVKKLEKKRLELQQKYKDTKVQIHDQIGWIEEIVSIKEGLALKIRNQHGQTGILLNASKESLVYGYDALEQLIDRLQSP